MLAAVAEKVWRADRYKRRVSKGPISAPLLLNYRSRRIIKATSCADGGTPRIGDANPRNSRSGSLCRVYKELIQGELFLGSFDLKNDVNFGELPKSCGLLKKAHQANCVAFERGQLNEYWTGCYSGDYTFDDLGQGGLLWSVPQWISQRGGPENTLTNNHNNNIRTGPRCRVY